MGLLAVDVTAYGVVMSADSSAATLQFWYVRTARVCGNVGHLFVTWQGSAYGRFRRALDGGNATIALAAAAELDFVSLPDGCRIEPDRAVWTLTVPCSFGRRAFAGAKASEESLGPELDIASVPSYFPRRKPVNLDMGSLLRRREVYCSI